MQGAKIRESGMGDPRAVESRTYTARLSIEACSLKERGAGSAGGLLLDDAR